MDQCVVDKCASAPSSLVVEHDRVSELSKELHRQQVVVRKRGSTVTHDDGRSLRDLREQESGQINESE